MYPCLFGGPSEGIDKGGDRLILLDIGVFCLETFAADDNRADQGQPARAYITGCDASVRGTAESISMGRSLAFYRFLLSPSSSGKKEGIHFAHNKWIFFTVLSILTGAMSGLYDKHLMRSMDVMTVQVWFNVYQCVIMSFILLFLWYPNRKRARLSNGDGISSLSPYSYAWRIGCTFMP